MTQLLTNYLLPAKLSVSRWTKAGKKPKPWLKSNIHVRVNYR